MQYWRVAQWESALRLKSEQMKANDEAQVFYDKAD